MQTNASPNDSEKTADRAVRTAYSPNQILAMIEGLKNATISMDAKFLSGAMAIRLLAQDIEDFRRRGARHEDVAACLASHGLKLSARTIRDYVAKARKRIEGPDSDLVRSLRERLVANGAGGDDMSAAGSSLGLADGAADHGDPGEQGAAVQETQPARTATCAACRVRSQTVTSVVRMSGADHHGGSLASDGPASAGREDRACARARARKKRERANRRAGRS